MRRRHFDELRPVCPVCRAASRETRPLGLERVEREADDHVIEGALVCVDAACRQEFPIIDGIPFLLPHLASVISDQALAILGRDDLSAATESLIGDAMGAGSAFNVSRQHLSSYASDHYGDRCDAGADADRAGEPGSTVAQCLERGLAMLAAPDASVAPPVLDLGCAVGRTTFELAARTDGLVLGVDLNVGMLRLAQHALRDGRVVFPLRRIGLVHDRCTAPVGFAGSDRVDFWACDALALPFVPGAFGTTVALNLLDSITDPLGLLNAIRDALAPGGQALIGAPYDWSSQVTPTASWIGGHSQRGPGAGRAETLLRSLLTPGAHPAGIAGLRITGETNDVPWQVRIHDRSTMAYLVHLIAAVHEPPAAR